MGISLCFCLKDGGYEYEPLYAGRLFIFQRKEHAMKMKCFFQLNKEKLQNQWEEAGVSSLYYIMTVLVLYLILLGMIIPVETYKNTGSVYPDDIVATVVEGCCRKPKKESMCHRYDKIRTCPRLSQESTVTLLLENERTKTFQEKWTVTKD